MADHDKIPTATIIDDHEINQPNIVENNLYDSKVAHLLGPTFFAANDGLVSTASLMLGMGAVSQDINAMVLTGILGLMAGACSSAIAEYISVDSTTLDIEAGQVDADRDPLRAAAASGLAFLMGAMVPLFVALFMEDYNVTLGVVEGPISVVLAVFGWVGAFFDGAPGIRAAMRVLLWGWVAMVVSFGLMVNSN